MKTRWAQLMAVGICALAVMEARPEMLFDGRGLEGWTSFLADPSARTEDVWSVSDGILICRGAPMGYLRTVRSFTNVHLVVEWRWAPGTAPGNSGVLLRINGEPQTLPRCLEVQLKSGDAGALYGFRGMKLSGPADRFTERPGTPHAGDVRGVKKSEAAEKEPGEWNVLEIVLAGGSLTATVNGRKVNAATDCEIVAGPIALQSEGGEIHFRRVELKSE